jgi:PAS domain S-box-containing protein
MGPGSQNAFTLVAVDDDRGLLRLIERRLRAEGLEPVCLHRGDETLAWLERERADLVLLDLQLADMDATELLEQLGGRGIDVPFVVMTGFGDERVAVEMMKRGARDYLMKDVGFVDLLPAVVERVRKQIDRERRLAEAEEALRLLGEAVNQARDGVLITTTGSEPEILFVNPAARQLTGYDESELLGRTPGALFGPDNDVRALVELRRTLSEGRSWFGSLRMQRKDGASYIAEIHVGPVRNGRGEATHLVAIQRDVTERWRLEEQVRQATKMEAIGGLAGGIAHDFNNMLAVIGGHTELLLDARALEPSQRAELQAIRAAVDYSARLTRQLLAFSRRQVLETRLLDLGRVINGTAELLRRALGEQIWLELSIADDAHPVQADPAQLQQVILNLAVNAREAMPAGGLLRIALDNIELSGDDAPPVAGMTAGAWVHLCVEDTGVGIDEDTLDHIFEPFFTTKPPGQGSGLGLAMVYGIIRQLHGQIRVEAEPGRGTAFDIYLPASREEPVPQPVKSDSAPLARARGEEWVLVVEDEEMVRDLVSECLAAAGYSVLSASQGREALEVYEEHGRPIDLLATDVVMPVMGGGDLADELVERQPDLRVLFISGYTRDALEPAHLEREHSHFMSKPFSPRILLDRVRAILDA